MLRKEESQVPLAISEIDQKQVLELHQEIQRSRAKLVGPDGKTQSLPVTLYEFLVKLIADLCEGQSVAIVQNDAQLTTVEGGRMLGGPAGASNGRAEPRTGFWSVRAGRISCSPITTG